MSVSARIVDKPLVPLIFTRAAGPTPWPSDRFFRPLDRWQRRQREVNALVLALPPQLEEAIRRRFRLYLTPRDPQTPRALPSRERGLFDSERLHGVSASGLCREVAIEADYIERTLEAVEGEDGLTGLARQYLFAVHLRRLRQLWAAFERREWPQGAVAAFAQALGR